MSLKLKTLIFFCLALLFSGTAYAQIDTIKVDFGSSISEGTWNNFTDGIGAGEFTMLKNTRDLYTGIGINVYDRFNGINTGGTTSPDAALDFPSTATSDSYFGNSSVFGGNLEPTGAMLITGLNPDKDYTFEVFASRSASDNREAQYRFTGATSDSVLLNPSNNTANTVSLTLKPNAEGEIDLTVSPGPNNDNSYGFYYLGALKMMYAEEDVLPPAITLTAPNGGEELTGTASYAINWEGINLENDVLVSYSLNNGTSWSDISTVDKSQNSLTWDIPDVNSSLGLVKVVSGATMDVSDSVFTIFPATGIVYDTLKIDFGSTESTGSWNNFLAQDGTGDIPALVNNAQEFTGIGLSIFDRFNGVNLNGTSTPDVSLNMPSTATSDSYYGNTPDWAGRSEPTAGLLFTGLNASTDYTFEVYATRMGVSDNRETKYTFIGEATDSVYLNPSNNESEIATITLKPATDGTITLNVSAGENNDNSYSFYYLTTLKVLYEHQDFAPSLAVISPNGGEEWTKGTVQEITWASNDIETVKIEYSADNGASWDSIGTATASTGSFEWTTPNIDTDSALVKVSSLADPAYSDVSNGVFKIDIPMNGDDRPLIVVLGSSTAAGSGASTSDSAWVWRYREHIQALDKDAYLVNLAVGGYSSYNIMPTDFTPPSGRPSPSVANNITEALTYNPWGIIVNLPSNDAAGNYTIAEQVSNLRSIAQVANAEDIPIYVTTTQPRNFSESQRNNLIEMRDSILTIFGDHAISIFDALANADGTVKEAFNSGDGVHLNNAGHKVISDIIIEANIWEDIVLYSTDIEVDTDLIPTAFELKNNYPNPFNPSTNIDFTLPVSSVVDINVFDITGRQVSALASGQYSAGTYSVIWDASGFATGVYIYRITARGDNNTTFTRSMKMLLLK